MANSIDNLALKLAFATAQLGGQNPFKLLDRATKSKLAQFTYRQATG
ncbi:hypothetical protein H6F67_10700 [Microcoleus sp. FACHB-1515]|nr:hypothetical protein [Microcoleus sp. FACHB-1515]MBD2090322.1 hypothetical protein [Microcoleus sp. FACHB-1515]